MKRNRVLKALVVILGFALGVTAVTLSSDRTQSVMHPRQGVDPTLSKLAGYKSWTLVNSNRYLMQPAASIACAIAFPPSADKDNPHRDKWVSVFVSPEGVDAMLRQLKPSFPFGTMIVKEKHGSVNDDTPELLTAMIKREKGFNPDGGDWEYFVLDGSASKIIAGGKQERCSGCHLQAQQTDYVLRTYLPNEALNNLH